MVERERERERECESGVVARVKVQGGFAVTRTEVGSMGRGNVIEKVAFRIVFSAMPTRQGE
jgi:hypothetical protein